MALNSKGSVVAAILGNSLVMLAKFVGFFFTGSSAMLAESIHSLADVMNQSLLLLGIYQSEKDADDLYLRGYGRDRFIWSLISAVGIFFLGCGVTLYHGITHLLHPTQVKLTESDYLWAIGILLFALVVEGAVLWIAYSSLKAVAPKHFWRYIRNEADPSVVAVLMEDFAACLGIIIALVALMLTHYTQASYWDAIGSILIGLLLGVIAVWLVHRNRQLLLGQSIPDHGQQAVLAVMNKHDFIEEIDHFHTESIGASRYEAQIEADFDEEALLKALDIDLKEAYKNIKTEEDFVAFCTHYGAESMRLMQRSIQDLEQEIKEAVPEIDYIDIEPRS